MFTVHNFNVAGVGHNMVTNDNNAAKNKILVYTNTLKYGKFINSYLVANGNWENIIIITIEPT